MDRSRKIAAACAGIALVTAGIVIATELSVHHWRPSALVHMRSYDKTAPLALQADANFEFTPSHYDGVYFYSIARDPFGHGQFKDRLDLNVYRYGHPGYGWLAGILSFGRASAVPTALLAIGLIGMALGGWMASRVADHFGYTPWAGLVVALSPGLAFAAGADTSEPIGVAIALTGVLMWFRGKRGRAAILFAAATLVKEPFVLVPAGIALWELAQMRRGALPKGQRLSRALALAASPTVLSIWYVELRVRFGIFPFKQTAGFLGVPGQGWIETLRNGIKLTWTTDTQIIDIYSAFTAVFAVALIIGAVRAVRLKTPFHAMYLPMFVLASMMRWWQLFFPKDAVRELVFVLLLLPAVLAVPRARAEPESGDGAPTESGTAGDARDSGEHAHA